MNNVRMPRPKRRHRPLTLAQNTPARPGIRYGEADKLLHDVGQFWGKCFIALCVFVVIVLPALIIIGLAAP